MKKISEMTLEELQDYALKLEGEKATAAADIAAQQAEMDDLRKTNLALQDRNNRLFMQVEQGRKPAEETPKEEEIPTCEDFARKNYKEILKR